MSPSSSTRSLQSPLAGAGPGRPRAVGARHSGSRIAFKFESGRPAESDSGPPTAGRPPEPAVCWEAAGFYPRRVDCGTKRPEVTVTVAGLPSGRQKI